MTDPAEPLFDGFTSLDVDTPEGPVHACVGGQGDALLLLHGYPQTHLMWWPVVQRLAEHHTVIAADLPGYGGSMPAGDGSKRAMATRLVAAMTALGHDAFAVAGHDRGGRVAYRMALDHPGRITRLAVLDIIPTGATWAAADTQFALGYWHWGFLAQPAPLPELLILGDPNAFWLSVERMGIKSGDPRFPDPVVDAYRAQLRDPDHVAAMCMDYRAGAGIDRQLDEAGGSIECPVLALWGTDGALPAFYADPLQPWRELAENLRGKAIDRAGHFLVEDQPTAAATALLDFLAGSGRAG